MKKDKRKWCLYMHKNKINGKAYIGITSNSKRRWGRKGNGYKQQLKFWNAICKYGWDGFTHEIILKDLSLEEASLLEEQYIEMFDSINNGYNTDKGGCFHTEEEIERIRQSNKGRKLTEEHKEKLKDSKRNKRPVICLENRVVYENPSECSKQCNIKLCNLFDVLRGRILTTNGMHFQYADEKIQKIEDIEKARKPKEHRAVVCVETGEMYSSIYQC